MRNLILDINCDLGEGAGNDRAIMPCISSANIACGGHAGNRKTMDLTVQLALEQGVAIGAHPGFPDRQGFGRRELHLERQVLLDALRKQLDLFYEIAAKNNAPVQHVKPHGALYNWAARDRSVADLIAELVFEIDPKVILVGLSGSESIRAGEEFGLQTASEVFADRRYSNQGTLVSRSQPGALIEDKNQAIQQIKMMVETGSVTSIEGLAIPIQTDTLCIHGDHPQAVPFVKEIRLRMEEWGIPVCSLRNFLK